MKSIRLFFSLLFLFSLTLHAADPSLPDGKNLQFGDPFSATEDSFTFGIIADRAGGNPLVGWPYFEQAIREMNSLHPDFVLMPGDLIDGYTRREGPDGATLDFNEQFDKFATYVNKLHMPLYFVAGNHDLYENDVKAPFLERFGRMWYSFDYRNVHFIALCTEAHPGLKDQRHHFTEEQVEWALADIAASKKTRHTVVFMHNPAWRAQGSLMYEQWLQIENALKGRKYTVLAAHTHRLSTDIRNGRPYYVMATSGGSQTKPHSFYRGRTHHIALAKIERDTLNLSVIELGATHSMEKVSKTNKSPLKIQTLQSLQTTGNGFQAEFVASVVNPLDKDIIARFSLQGLTPKGWRSLREDRKSVRIAPGDSAGFRTVLTVTDPHMSYPPTLRIHAEGDGLKIVEYSEMVPVFADGSYRILPTWYTVAPFNGEPMAYSTPPFSMREVLPAMFRDFGPEKEKWNPEDTFAGTIGWKQVIANEKGQVDFGKEYGYLFKSIGYAVSFIDSPDDRMVYARFLVNDYGRLFINGESVGKDVFCIEDGTVTLPVWLKKGRNEIMVKPANLSHNWYFSLKIADPERVLKL